MNIFNKIYKAADVRLLDEYTIDSERISSLDLMERAASEVVKRVVKKNPNDRVFNILAGCGNNGGDGFAVARLLREAGFQVTVYAIQMGRMTPDCAVNRSRYLRVGGVCVDVFPEQDFVLAQNGILMDALLGVGLNRPVKGWLATVIARMNEFPGKKIAIDVPSGLMGEDNTGNDGAIFEADYTFTFQFPKLAFLLAGNSKYVGEFEVLDIGLHPEALRKVASNWYYLTEEAVAHVLPRLEKFAHKGDLGHALLVAGSQSMVGAAILAGGGAVRSGTGLLTLHVPRALKETMHLAVPEALVEVDRDESCFTGGECLDKYRAIGIGPGLGMDEKSRAGLFNLLTNCKGAMVLDADALNILAANPEWLSLLPTGAVLTPHPKEFERLVGKSQNDFDRLNKLSTFAGLYRVCVLLKGAHTVIATPTGDCYFNMTGNPGMAKGGSGDVLTGVITALLANGLEATEAALVGVYVHGMAGDLAEARFGQRGMRSGDLVDFLGQAWRRLENIKKDRF